MKYLITDLNIKLDGHRYGFMHNLMHYAGEHLPQDEYVFLTNTSSDFELKSHYSHIQALTVSNQEQETIDSASNPLKKAKLEWDIIFKYALNFGSDRVIFMFLDSYQAEIGKAKTPFKISGIWFAPYSRMEAEGNTLPQKIKLFFTKTRKKLTMQWALRNENFDKVFILNDEEMPDWLNGKTKRFYTLPDPYFKYPSIPEYDIRSQYGIPQENLIFLQFGYIDERKNVKNIVLAFNKLSPEILKRSTLLFIGKFKANLKEHLLNLKNADVQTIFREEFVSNEEMESSFAQSDVILRMNINFFGSSGIIGVAAQHDKPVIASDTGVMAKIVEKYKLGKIVNPYSTDEIAQAITEFHEDSSSLKIDGSQYRNSHDIKSFAETLLS
jgi:glycosyltransferase involved in cell wall biosynthesis